MAEKLRLEAPCCDRIYTTQHSLDKHLKSGHEEDEE